MFPLSLAKRMLQLVLLKQWGQSQPAYNKIDFFLKNDTSKTVDNKKYVYTWKQTSIYW